MTDSLIIRNARVVNEGQQFDADVLIQGDRIERIDSSIDHDGDLSIDAEGRLLLPGMIDDQVHFREPGLTHKANIASESRAAVAGGITSYMEMPNTSPPTTDHDRLEEKYAIAAESSLSNFAFYLGGTNDNLEQIKTLDPTKAAGIKVFMGASTGNMLVDDPKILEGIFAEAPCLIATHCEDTPTILANHQRAMERFGEALDISQHPVIRSEEACFLSSSLAVGLAKRHQTQLHVLHLTTAKELALFTAGPIEDKQITVEACVHHLFFDQDDYQDKGNLIKCNPAIKRPQDRDALLTAVADDVIDVIATDHAPHTLAEKRAAYPQAPAGLPLVQDALPSLFEHYFDGRLSLEQVVNKTSHAVAKRFAVHQRGFIREGYFADLTLVDLHRPQVCQRDRVFSRCGWSPFEGFQFRASIHATVVSGHLAYHDGQVDESQLGQRLQFDRQS